MSHDQSAKQLLLCRRSEAVRRPGGTRNPETGRHNSIWDIRNAPNDCGGQMSQNESSDDPTAWAGLWRTGGVLDHTEIISRE